MHKKLHCLLVVILLQLGAAHASISIEGLDSVVPVKDSSVINTVVEAPKINQTDTLSREQRDSLIQSFKSKDLKKDNDGNEGAPSLVLQKKEKSPKVAGLLSVMLPGAGQVYNRGYKAWWKLGIMYGSAYLLYRNILYYSKAKDFYHGALVVHDMDTTPDVIESELVNYVDTYEDVEDYLDISAEDFSKRDVGDVEDRFNGTQGDLQNMYIFSFVLYGLNVLDAVVDAHLKTFDVSDDLSMRIKPSVLNMNGSYSGLGPAISLKFSLK